MSSKHQQSKSHKLIIFIFFLFVFLCVMRQRLSASNLQSQWRDDPQPPLEKIPPSLADALVHYATANRTPQQTLQEISLTKTVLQNRSPCNFLVFGLGFDSLLWKSLNHNGRTVFLEEDGDWIERVKGMGLSLEIYHVEYDTQVEEAVVLLEDGKRDEECKKVRDPRYSNCRLAHKKLPKVVYDTEWDLIMVDAPKSWSKELPGRMTVIYTVGLMAKNRSPGAKTDIFVHDADRWVDNKFSRAFLCEGYMKGQVGMLRHFTILSHRTSSNLPFCP
nr:glucuronoxylan 4-O-methyltransferase 3-like [Ipomoea batatas]GMD66556.1 glucuronoxylan 4-O-methyltransferase 3-like [Ipomoea batatas]